MNIISDSFYPTLLGYRGTEWEVVQDRNIDGKHVGAHSAAEQEEAMLNLSAE